MSRFLRAPHYALLAAALWLAPHSGQAATILFAGADTDGTQGSWRTSSVLKPLDADHDNVYGTDGYLAVYSGANAGTPTKVASYLSSVSVLAPSTYTSGNLTSPNYRSADLVNGSGTVAGTGITGVLFGSTSSVDFLSFTLRSTANFRLGIAVDNANIATITPPTLTVSQIVGGAATATTSTTDDRLIDYYFFDISGVAGDSFKISGTNAFGTAQTAGIFAATFDTIPEPGSLAILAGGMASLLRLRRRAR